MGLQSEVAKAAYELYEKGGRIHGHDLEHWIEAEGIVNGSFHPDENPLSGSEARTIKRKTPASSKRPSKRDGTGKLKATGRNKKGE